jgi:hypothetical protein
MSDADDTRPSPASAPPPGPSRHLSESQRAEIDTALAGAARLVGTLHEIAVAVKQGPLILAIETERVHLANALAILDPRRCDRDFVEVCDEVLSRAAGRAALAARTLGQG